MTEMPKRDITGKCEGECENQVSKMEREQQKKLDEQGMEHSTAETPSVPHAKDRDHAPGSMGGHV